MSGLRCVAVTLRTPAYSEIHIKTNARMLVGGGLWRFGGGDAKDLVRGRHGAYVAHRALDVGSPVEGGACIHARGDAVDGYLDLSGFDDDDLIVWVDDIGGALLAWVESSDVAFEGDEGGGGRADAGDARAGGRGCGWQAVAVDDGRGKFAGD